MQHLQGLGDSYDFHKTHRDNVAGFFPYSSDPRLSDKTQIPDRFQLVQSHSTIHSRLLQQGQPATIFLFIHTLRNMCRSFVTAGFFRFQCLDFRLYSLPNALFTSIISHFQHGDDTRPFPTRSFLPIPILAGLELPNHFVTEMDLGKPPSFPFFT